jgi:hypothetical protein
MAIRCHPVRAKSHDRFRGPEECLRRSHVAPLAQHRVDQVAVPINRPIEVAPPAADLQVGLVKVPVYAGSAPGAVPPFAQRISQDRQQFRIPIPNRLMANDEPAEQEHFAQIPERQPIAQTAENHKADDVARKGGPVQHAVTALVELPTAVPAAKPLVALSRDLTTLRNRRGATTDTIYTEIRTAPAASSPTKFTAEVKTPSGARPDRTNYVQIGLDSPIWLADKCRWTGWSRARLCEGGIEGYWAGAPCRLQGLGPLRQRHRDDPAALKNGCLP